MQCSSSQPLICRSKTESLPFESLRLHTARQPYAFQGVVQTGFITLVCWEVRQTLFLTLNSGVIKALYEQNLLPEIVSGSSAGSLMAAMMCCTPEDRFSEFLTDESYKWNNAANEPWHIKLQRFLSRGVMLDHRDLKVKLRAVIGDVTFAEAYARTGRVLNISITSANDHGLPKVLNHVLSPDVVVYSAVVASSSMPCLIEPSSLLIKKPDGTIETYGSEGTSWSGSLSAVHF